MTSADDDAVTADSPAKPAETAPNHGIGRRRRWRRVMIVMTAIGGILASIAMFAVIDGRRGHVRELRFALLADDYLQTINSGMLDATELLYSLRAYFQSRDRPVTRSEFESFSRALRTRVPGLRDTGWAPLVPAAQRETFEQAVRQSGIADFRISERDAAGPSYRRATGRSISRSSTRNQAWPTGLSLASISGRNRCAKGPSGMRWPPTNRLRRRRSGWSMSNAQMAGS